MFAEEKKSFKNAFCVQYVEFASESLKENRYIIIHVVVQNRENFKRTFRTGDEFEFEILN